MRRWIGILGTVALGLTASGMDAEPAAAQDRPNFSGVWTQARDAGAGRGGRGGRPGTLGSGWGPEFAIVQSADTLMLERNFFSRGDLQRPLHYRFALDGSETRNAVLMGRGEQASTSTVAWNGERLVITTTSTANGPEGAAISVEVTRTLWLEASSAPGASPTLVIETVRSGVLGGPPSTTRTEYTQG